MLFLLKFQGLFLRVSSYFRNRQFDNVFLMLENFYATTDEETRLLYVAMTRAKTNLTIHLNTNILVDITTKNLKRIENTASYLPPNELAIHLSLKDVWLDYFINRQYLLSTLQSGAALVVNGDRCLDSQGNTILKFSTRFVGHMENMQSKNYTLKSAKVNFIVYWKKEDSVQEVKIVLPELYFQRDGNK